jgi:ABC-type uncharacterized transport system permease subunit
MNLIGILLIALLMAGFGLVLSHLGLDQLEPWLLIHIGGAASAYVCFAVSVTCAWSIVYREKKLRLGATEVGLQRLHTPLLTLELWMFRAIYLGFFLLSLSLLVGAFAGNPAATLKFTHKTVFAALAWLCFGVLIAGRVGFGWRGRAAVRLVYSGSVLLLLAYLGTWFVLEVLLGR